MLCIRKLNILTHANDLTMTLCKLQISVTWSYCKTKLNKRTKERRWNAQKTCTEAEEVRKFSTTVTSVDEQRTSWDVEHRRTASWWETWSTTWRSRPRGTHRHKAERRGAPTPSLYHVTRMPTPAAVTSHTYTFVAKWGKLMFNL